MNLILPCLFKGKKAKSICERKVNECLSSKKLIPDALSALEHFKIEVASELGIALDEGYNGDASSRDNRGAGTERRVKAPRLEKIQHPAPR